LYKGKGIPFPSAPRVRQKGGRFARLGEGQACRFDTLRVEAEDGGNGM